MPMHGHEDETGETALHPSPTRNACFLPTTEVGGIRWRSLVIVKELIYKEEVNNYASKENNHTGC